jgi:predicted ATPase
MLARALSHQGHVDEALLLIQDAEAVIERTNHRMHEAEVYRVKGEILRSRADTDAAESAFLQALTVARGQRARGWELRAATSLARLWQQQGRVEDARTLLSPIHNAFTEGFNTPDLQEAEALLCELAAN